MKNLKVIIILILLLTGCKMSNEDNIDLIFNDYNKPDFPGAAVMVIKNGEVIFEKCYGLANVANHEPITPPTNFRLASVTKQFTAMCVLKLIDEGKIEFETTLSELFPSFPDYGKKITIKNLLQHTSGLIDYEELIPDTATIQVKDKDVLNLILKTDSTYFVPGNKHQYSNTGYALLSLIVEKVSGKLFRDFLKENIFTPLGMDNTIAYEKNINEVNNRAFGYTIENDSIKLTDQSITSAVLGDGGIYSSLNDLYKWDQALYTDKLIDHKYLDESWTEGITKDGKVFPYGFGWRLENYENDKVVYHTGSTSGFRNIIYRIPERKFTIIILTNRNSGDEMITLKLVHKILPIFLK